MISKRELMVRICELEAEVDYILDILEPKKQTIKKVKKNGK